MEAFDFIPCELNRSAEFLVHVVRCLQHISLQLAQADVGPHPRPVNVHGREVANQYVCWESMP